MSNSTKHLQISFVVLFIVTILVFLLGLAVYKELSLYHHMGKLIGQWIMLAVCYRLCENTTNRLLLIILSIFCIGLSLGSNILGWIMLAVVIVTYFYQKYFAKSC